MNVRTCATWGLGLAAILLGPILVIFSIPITIGIGRDIFDLFGAAPFALALCSPLAFVLLRRLPLRRAVAEARLWPRRLENLIAHVSRPRRRDIRSRRSYP